jgi:hypothetical protein
MVNKFILYLSDYGLQCNKHNSYWYGVQYQDRQTSLGSWYGSVEVILINLTFNFHSSRETLRESTSRALFSISPDNITILVSMTLEHFFILFKQNHKLYDWNTWYVILNKITPYRQYKKIFQFFEEIWRIIYNVYIYIHIKALGHMKLLDTFVHVDCNGSPDKVKWTMGNFRWTTSSFMVFSLYSGFPHK